MPHSRTFIGKPYTRGEGQLQLGDKVNVHPIHPDHEPTYQATIIEYKGNVCLDVPDGKFKAPLNERLFSRLEKIV